MIWMEQKDCLFCRIASKQLPANVIYEDEKVLAFLDINPLTEGHTLVIPKTHAESVFDIDAEYLKHLTAVAQKIANKMKETGQAEGLDLVQANGEAGDQTVFHFHLHIIPRKSGDGLQLREWWVSRVQKVDQKKMAELANKLKTEKVEEPEKIEEKVEEPKPRERSKAEIEWVKRQMGIA